MSDKIDFLNFIEDFKKVKALGFENLIDLTTQEQVKPMKIYQELQKIILNNQIYMVSKLNHKELILVAMLHYSRKAQLCQ